MKDKGHTPGSTRALEMGSIQQKDYQKKKKTSRKFTACSTYKSRHFGYPNKLLITFFFIGASPRPTSRRYPTLQLVIFEVEDPPSKKSSSTHTHTNTHMPSSSLQALILDQEIKDDFFPFYLPISPIFFQDLFAC
jgi:hypothetical protein